MLIICWHGTDRIMRGYTCWIFAIFMICSSIFMRLTWGLSLRRGMAPGYSLNSRISLDECLRSSIKYLLRSTISRGWHSFQSQNCRPTISATSHCPLALSWSFVICWCISRMPCCVSRIRLKELRLAMSFGCTWRRCRKLRLTTSKNCRKTLMSSINCKCGSSSWWLRLARQGTPLGEFCASTSAVEVVCTFVSFWRVIDTSRRVLAYARAVSTRIQIYCSVTPCSVR